LERSAPRVQRGFSLRTNPRARNCTAAEDQRLFVPQCVLGPASAGLFFLKTEADFLEDATVGAAQHLSARRCALCQTKPDAGAGCPRSLAHLAVRWWLRGTKKMPRLGGTAPGQKHSLGGARLVRPSRPHSHMLAYKDLTRRRNTETRLCLLCGVPSGS